MDETDKGRYAAIETTGSNVMRAERLTLRFCDTPTNDRPALRIGFMYDDDDNEVCWLSRKQAKRLLVELLGEYRDG